MNSRADSSNWRVDRALRSWHDSRVQQEARSRSGGKAQEGSRAAVTGGKHLDGIVQVVTHELESTGAPGLTYLTGRKATLPGFYRAAKAWDLLVLQNEQPVLCVEFKSMKGSVSNNLNNRADEVFGVAEDMRQAELHGIVPKTMRRAYVFVLNLDEESTGVPDIPDVPIGKMDKEFLGASYVERAGIMCERMWRVGLYHLAWMVAVREEPFQWVEPRAAVGWNAFSKGLHGMFEDGVVRPLLTSEV
jgi:Restriction endonuclease XhoI